MQPTESPSKDASASPDKSDVPFGSNEVRLSLRQWLVAAIIVCTLLYCLPRLWERMKPLEPGPDYRVPFSLGNDYWVYDRHSQEACQEDRSLVVGDSVVWGHYVATDETLSHYLAERVPDGRFANLAVDGIHPAAMAGLVECYGGAIRDHDVILHCNLLWMSSPRHDLTTDKEFAFNHPRLVPQFYPRIPCYEESLSERLTITVQRRVPLFSWTRHLEIAYFDNQSVARWTIDHPNESPTGRLTLELPSPDEPPSPKPVAEPWTTRGLPKFNPPWVDLETSLQWWSFRRTIEILQDRGNRVFVLVGPLNEHMLTDASWKVYQERKRQVQEWLQRNGIPHLVASPLDSDLYADASHPLAPGYDRLAAELAQSEAFARFRSGGAGREPD